MRLFSTRKRGKQPRCKPSAKSKCQNPYFPESHLEITSGQTGLANDGFKGTDSQFDMISNRDSKRGIQKSFLHYHMAAALAHRKKAMVRKNSTHLLSR
jgi:hypothetical protein